MLSRQQTVLLFSFVLLTLTTMTKRTAALAAASKLSTSKGKSKIRKVGKKELSTMSKSTSSSKINTNRDTSQSYQPWFTVFTKSDQQYDEYMSKEWSIEKRGDQALFEKLTLEGDTYQFHR